MQISKMHSSGNDFCIVDFIEKTDFKSLAVKICNRKLGVGADGLIVVKRSPRLEMLYYNMDGSTSSMNSNALRCFVRYSKENGYFKGDKVEVLTGAGLILVEIENENPFECKINLGKPNFNNQMLHATDMINNFGRVIDIEGIKVTIYSLFIGSIQTVILVNSFEDEIIKYAELIHSYKLFAKKTSVNFAIIKNKNEIDVKTYEKGVGFTYASGDGCAASVIALNKLNLIRSNVRCNLELGYLNVDITKRGYVYLTGPAEKLFTCDFKEEN